MQRYYLLLVSTFVILNSLVSYSAPTFSEIEPCGSATVVSGNTCSNVKVKFTLNNCRLDAQEKMASKIICEKNTIKARFQEGNYRYEALFEKVNDGWGGVSWKAIGTTRQLAQTQVASQPVMRKHESEKPPEVTMASEPARAPASEILNSIKINAFADFRSSWTHVEKGSSTRHREKTGYLLEDGAIYFSFKQENFEANIDLPIHRDMTSGTNDANLAIGKTKSQVYLTYIFSDELKIVAGQFDTIFGFELNDSKDRLFGNAGLVFGQTLPVVHDGAYLQYSSHGFTAKIISANPSDRDSLGTTANDSNTEVGATLGWSNAWIRAQVGYLTRAQKNLSDVDAHRNLTDSLLGFTVGKFNLDMQYSVVDNPQKNNLTADTVDAEDPGSGFMALLSYAVTDKLTLGFRYEALSDDPGASGYYRANSYAGVVTYTFTPNLMGRCEWVDITTDRRASFTTDAYGEQRFDLGVVAKF